MRISDWSSDVCSSDLAQARAQALARELEQAEARNPAQLHAGAVEPERTLQAVLDLALVLVARHVDEIDHQQAAKVADAPLAGDFLGRPQVGVERGLTDAATIVAHRVVSIVRHRTARREENRR